MQDRRAGHPMDRPQERPTDRATTADLLTRYDRPGPRYTSYPTAIEFDERVGLEAYLERLEAADALSDAPLSVYVHLPFCAERCLFCGCHVIITPHKDRARPYLGFLHEEIELLAARLPQRRKLSQLHLGGGTPTYHSPVELDALLEAIFRHFEATSDAELSVEVDPRVTTSEHLATLAAHGFNRISLGVQDFTPEVQEEVRRVQSVEETGAMMDEARRLGFGGVNVDLIYGLPLQTPETFESTVEAVIQLGADRAAVYSFAYVPWIRGHQKGIDQAKLPERETKFQLFGIARERFLAAGYAPIGMDHFARPDDELAVARSEGRLRRNFQGYTVLSAEDTVGLGVSAIGDIRGAMVQNHKKLSSYGRAIRAGRIPVARGLVRSADDELHGAVIHDLMCNFSVSIPDIERRFGVHFSDAFADDLRLLEELGDEGLVRIDEDCIEATPMGELFIRNIAMCFDRYWREKHEGEDRPIFSRTV